MLDRDKNTISGYVNPIGANSTASSVAEAVRNQQLIDDKSKGKSASASAVKELIDSEVQKQAAQG